jgi:poly(A) polymerase
MSLPDRIPPTAWMSAAPTRTVLQALSAGGATVRFVGGCVRDAMLGLHPDDIDLATTDTPDAVIGRLKKAGLKAVPTGLAHGTVTAVVPPATFQVTTLRQDVATDGRHAVVAFGTDWAADAARRDFTINALYADGDGTLHDFTGGRADLAAGVVRFIGDPAARVAEDYLRVLRFFRFHARFGRDRPDAASLAACAAAAGQLERLSGERVRDELLKILGLPNADAALTLMQDCGVLPALLPDSRYDTGRFRRLMDLQQVVAAASDVQPEVWPRLAALFVGDGLAMADRVAERLKLSNAQCLRLQGLLDPAQPDPAGVVSDESVFRLALYRLGAERCRDALLLAASAGAVSADLAVARAVATTTWQRPVFPLRGADVLSLGFTPGPTVSALLRELEDWWAGEGFRPGREACLQRLQQRVQISAQE